MANVKFTDLPNLGNITANTIVPVVDSNTNYTVTAANLQSYVNSTTGNIVAGNILASNNIQALANVTAFNFIGNGSQLTGMYGNANVATFLAAFGSNNVSTTGNVTAGYILGNGSQLTGLPASYSNANVTTLLAAFGSNSISTTGNVTADYVFGNISGATGGYGNSNVQAVLQTYTGTLTAASISASGNIRGNFFIGNGSQLTGITASFSGNMVGNINANTYNITNANVIAANTFTGNGSQLTGIPTSIQAGTGISVSAATGVVTITNNNPTPYANANVAAYLPTYSGNLSAGNITSTGNISGTFVGNGATLSNIVTSITAGSGISVNAATGAVTITATGGGGSGNSISNGNTNIRIDTANGNIAANVNTYGNAMVWFPNPSGFPTMNLRSSVNINSQSGSYNNSSPFDGGIVTTGAASIAGQVLNPTGIFASGVLSASGQIVSGGVLTAGGGINTNGTNIQTTNGNISTQGGQISTTTGGFSASLRTVAQGSTGTAGQIFWDANYIYVCTATNTWKRAALTTY